ncbi:hypothetical protein DPEC_G00120960 [Dallia pectoralis]|uniref:Uncharacterized protein n=1 Tax=Dallia pectoralis TaxID=75939 RepID=A0ACC2GQ30_DALPE|nr:hypothetical protein DPEC_G00120960 [Dallia pectoralis]
MSGFDNTGHLVRCINIGTFRYVFIFGLRTSLCTMRRKTLEFPLLPNNLTTQGNLEDNPQDVARRPPSCLPRIQKISKVGVKCLDQPARRPPSALPGLVADCLERGPPIRVMHQKTVFPGLKSVEPDRVQGHEFRSSPCALPCLVADSLEHRRPLQVMPQKSVFPGLTPLKMPVLAAAQLEPSAPVRERPISRLCGTTLPSCTNTLVSIGNGLKDAKDNGARIRSDRTPLPGIPAVNQMVNQDTLFPTPPPKKNKKTSCRRIRFK